MDLMGISETKMKIVIDNHFKSECNVDTSIRQAFEKGFRVGFKKGQSVRKTTRRVISSGRDNHFYICGSCRTPVDPQDNYCRECGRQIVEDEQNDEMGS